MHFVVDASLASAWLLPEEYSDAAETAIASISEPCPVPSLFWFEIRNILTMSERRGWRLPSIEAFPSQRWTASCLLLHARNSGSRPFSHSD